MSRASVLPARARSTASAMLVVTDSAIDRASSACSPAAEPKWWSRLAWVRPISAATAFSVTACGPSVEQQLARGFERGGPALFGAQAFASY